MRRSWLLLGAALAIACSLSSSCGGGGGDELTKAEYVSTLNALCEDFTAREQEIGEPHTLADLADRGDRIADAFDQALGDKVRTLAAPDAVAAQAGRLRAVAKRQSGTLRRLAEAARRGHLSRVRALAARNSALNSEASALARRLGADSCA